jgi:hypothetical protein
VFSPLTRGSTSRIDQAFRQVLHQELEAADTSSIRPYTLVA